MDKCKVHFLEISVFHEHLCSNMHTVKPVLRGHIWDKEKVALYDRWPQKRFKAYEIFNDMTRKWWTFNTGGRKKGQN
jgi:hypothetical protein